MGQSAGLQVSLIYLREAELVRVSWLLLFLSVTSRCVKRLSRSRCVGYVLRRLP